MQVIEEEVDVAVVGRAVDIGHCKTQVGGGGLEKHSCREHRDMSVGNGEKVQEPSS